jgi:voltage-gated potassium channel
MDERSARIAARFEAPMLIAALLVVPAIIIEESSPGKPWETVGVVLNYAIWIAFLIEAVVMLCVVPSKRRWVADHPLEVIVVLLTPPFFLSAIAPIRVLRLLRLVRLLRLAPLVRRLFTVQGVKYSALLAIVTVLAAGAAFHQAESYRSFGDGLYWAATTMTTVGADFSPHTTVGRLVAIVVMLVGLGFAALVTGAVARAFIERTGDADPPNATPVPSGEKLLADFRELSVRMRALELALEARFASQAEAADRSAG